MRDSAALYSVAFFGAVVLVALWEAIRPRRVLIESIRLRWTNNIAGAVVNSVVLRWSVPITGVSLAHAMAERGWGLLHVVPVPSWIAFAAALLVLDLARYAEHRLLHGVPFLWRLHRVHHTDHDLDFTTGVRFHPLEVICGAPVTLALIAFLGPPVGAVVAYETLFAVIVFVSHGNVSFPPRAERVLRLVFTTPDVHRVHHSTELIESTGNLGAMLTWWDRLAGAGTR